MKKQKQFLIIIAVSLILPIAILLITTVSCSKQGTAFSRPEGPCDIYAADGNPCVAAHSSTRALYASYNGPLYQVMRQSDGKTLDIGVVQPNANNAGGYADANAQDEFCANTYCWITILYDQSGKGNDLIQAPRGAFSGPAMGGFNNIPMADMAPVTLMGHKVYGIFIEPGMGLRWNDAVGTAVDDQAEGQYWVINGQHYNNGCCYDYGNGETDSRDDGDGTMETTYFGNANYWYHGQDEGPWIMTDQENNLVGCVNPSPNDKYCADLESVNWRFITATADGEPHHWRSMGGDAQGGDLKVMFDGPRIINDRNSYDPMRKQGAIILGNGGDNSNGSQGTFYEGAMTAPGTFPSEETNQKIQANVVAAKYNVCAVSIAPEGATDKPTGLQTFAPLSTNNTTVTFTNNTEDVVSDLKLSITVPKGWKSIVAGTNENSATFEKAIEPGATVNATFEISSGKKAYNGDIVGLAEWKSNGKKQSETAVEKVRNVNPLKINEFRITDGSADNTSNSFIELYNASNEEVDISSWTLTHHPTQLPFFSSIAIPKGTKIPAQGFYLLGLSNSGLAVEAKKGESTIYVRNTIGMSVGDEIEIGSGATKEKHKIASLSSIPEPDNAQASPFNRRRRTAPGTPTTLWQPLPDGPVITIPAGSNNIPVTSTDNFKVGDKMAIGYGATYPTVAQDIEKYEVVTITEVGKAGTQAWLSMDAKAGDTNIKVSSVENISVGDQIRLDIDSEGHGIETVTVVAVGTQSSRSTFNGPLGENDDPGTGLELAEPLKYDHASNMPFSARGTGITFEPATKFAHSSNEPVLPLNYAITIDEPLSYNHDIDAVVKDEYVKTAGYQGEPLPDQWFGGPALSSSAGNMVLRDAERNVVDGLNYGGLVDPWAAEGYQAESGTGKNGCFVTVPSQGRGFGFFGQQSSRPDKSSGRYPDGTDSDSNCDDFYMQSNTILALAAEEGSINIKVPSVDGLAVGQTIIVGDGETQETAIIANIGTTGGTTINKSVRPGTKAIPVASASGFNTGQTITIGSGQKAEEVLVSSVVVARRRFGNRNNETPSDTIKINVPTRNMHAEGELLAGSGIILSNALANAHEVGSQIANGIPTPGKPNMYIGTE